MCEDIADQFAFRPTGSTTAAIIELLQQTTNQLLTNVFVVIISTDFSRASDTVRHSEMMKEYGRLVLPDHIVNWLTGYFAECGHITKFQGIMSAIAFINASVIQGSGIGPSSYIVVASDLKPINRENKIPKYANDSYLLIGSNHLGTAKSEFQHIQSWASRNNLCLNTVLSNLFDPAGRTRQNHEAAGRTSKL